MIAIIIIDSTMPNIVKLVEVRLFGCQLDDMIGTVNVQMFCSWSSIPNLFVLPVVSDTTATIQFVKLVPSKEV
jgi:hypothetical protein